MNSRRYECMLWIDVFVCDVYIYMFVCLFAACICAIILCKVSPLFYGDRLVVDMNNSVFCLSYKRIAIILHSPLIGLLAVGHCAAR